MFSVSVPFPAHQTFVGQSLAGRRDLAGTTHTHTLQQSLKTGGVAPNRLTEASTPIIPIFCLFIP